MKSVCCACNGSSAGYKLVIVDELDSSRCHRRVAVRSLQPALRARLVVTSNLPFDKWAGVFASERLTGALLNRLTHHVHILEMNGETSAPTTGRTTTPPTDAETQKNSARSLLAFPNDAFLLPTLMYFCYGVDKPE